MKPALPLLLLALAGSSLLSSCYTLGAKIRAEGLDEIRVGKSTMAEVRAALGNPIRESDYARLHANMVHFGDEASETIWLYWNASGSLDGMTGRSVVVEFDKRGRVSDYFFTANLKDPKAKPPSDAEFRDFDLWRVKKEVRPGRTTETQVQALLGKPYRESTLNKPKVAKRLSYMYQWNPQGEEKDPFVMSKTSRFQQGRLYQKIFVVDIDSTGKVLSTRGASDFPEDKDRHLEK